MNQHKEIGFLKSAIRIAGFIILIPEPLFGVVLLVAAEIVGIVEETVV